MENNEQTQEQDPNVIGKLTPEEQQALNSLKQQTAQYMNKIGEFEVMKTRCLKKLDQIDVEGQSIMNAISERLKLEPGKQWVALLDGTIRLVDQPQPGQAEGAAPPTA